jgi:hypothetical protein
MSEKPEIIWQAQLRKQRLSAEPDRAMLVLCRSFRFPGKVAS